MRILLIEEDASFALLVRQLLAGNDEFEICHAGNLDAALQLADSGGIDLILLDLHLPDSSGCQTFDAIRARFPALPVIILSGCSDRETALRAVRRGAQDYLIKETACSETLVRVVQYGIERKRNAIALRASEERYQLLSISNQLLATERGALKQAVAAMEQALGIVGHELRTPLAGLRATSELLLDAEAQATGDATRFLKSMHEDVMRMSETVNDLLEAALLNSGKQRWRFNEYRVADVCREAIETQRPLIDAPYVRLSHTFEPPDAVAIGDGGAVSRLISNLLSNSRKHTDRGSIDVSARITRKSEQNWVEFCVRDTGRGIPPEIATRLGVPFALNSGVVPSHRASGSGLGLAIVKGIAEAHGGNVDIESIVGGGTTVTVALRADLPAPVQHAGKIIFSLPRAVLAAG